MSLPLSMSGYRREAEKAAETAEEMRRPAPGREAWKARKEREASFRKGVREELRSPLKERKKKAPGSFWILTMRKFPWREERKGRTSQNPAGIPKSPSPKRIFCGCLREWPFRDALRCAYCWLRR